MTANDKDQGEWYTVSCNTTQFTLPVRYQDLVYIEGVSGVVVRATDTETGKYVAIKKMDLPFHTAFYAKRTYRELKLLMHLNHPDAQVVQLYNVFIPEKSLNDFQTLYFVFNHIDYNLHQVIKHCVTLTEDHIKFIIYSLLRGLKFIHSAGIVHRDLKPQNIRINENGDTAIVNFDLAHWATDSHFPHHFVCKWWHAPELLQIERHYDDKVDIWSIGCIMAELILRRPLFCGTDMCDQMHKIFDIIGTSDSTIINDLYAPCIANYLNHWPPKPRKDYNELFGFKYDPVTHTPIYGVSPDGIDLLDQLLTFDHRLRPTAEEALAHPFLESYRDLTDEPTKEALVDEHQNAEYTIAGWKSIIWQMVEEFVSPPWVNNEDDGINDK